MKTIALDATPLRGGSGHRGIGRFIYDLLHGLSALHAQWAHSFRIRVIHDLDWRGPRWTEDPAEAAETLFAARASAGDALVHLRRLTLDRAARHLGADLLHMPEALGTPVTRRVRRVVTAHDLIPLRMPAEYLRGSKRFTQRAVDARRYQSADRIVAISAHTKADLHQLLEVPLDKIDVVPNGIDVSHWGAAERAGDRARLEALGVGRRPYVLYVGYWDDRKDVPTMLRAVAEARALTDVELVWAGHFGERDLFKLRKYVARHGVSEHFAAARQIGFVSADDLAVLYRHAHAHLFLSRLEGFGLSVAEAMASGCPVIVAKDSGADEIGGAAVIAVPQRDAHAAARAIVQLGRDPEERRRRREAGLARSAQFSRETMARGYLDVWRRVLASA
jgi:glycosyltransferase involved in cell wall biosynthesis